MQRQREQERNGLDSFGCPHGRVYVKLVHQRVFDAWCSFLLLATTQVNHHMCQVPCVGSYGTGMPLDAEQGCIVPDRVCLAVATLILAGAAIHTQTPSHLDVVRASQHRYSEEEHQRRR